MDKANQVLSTFDSYQDSIMDIGGHLENTPIDEPMSCTQINGKKTIGNDDTLRSEATTMKDSH